MTLAPQGGTNCPGGAYDPETQTVFVFSETTVSHMSIVKGEPGQTEFEYVRALPSLPPGFHSPDGFRPGLFTIQGLPLMKPPYGRLTAIDLARAASPGR